MEHDRRIAGGIGLGLVDYPAPGGAARRQNDPRQPDRAWVALSTSTCRSRRSNATTASRGNAQPVLLLVSTSEQPAPEIQAMSQRQGLEICLVSNLDELEAALANTSPLTVAWDLTSARPGDWNLVRRLRHHPTLSQAPVIIYGQLPESDSPPQPLGLTGFVAKSPNPQTLLETVNALCPAEFDRLDPDRGR